MSQWPIEYNPSLTPEDWLYSTHITNLPKEYAIAAHQKLPPSYWIGFPQPTTEESQRDLIEMGIAGLYQRPGTEGEDLAEFWRWYNLQRNIRNFDSSSYHPKGILRRRAITKPLD